jgi:hypothetical protein
MNLLRILSFSVIMAGFAACSKSSETTPVTNTPFDPQTATVAAAGTFAGRSGYTVNGDAKAYNHSSGKKLHFTSSFTTQAGPLLKVYLAKDVNSAAFVDLGVLKSNSGVQTYDVPANINFSEYKYAVVWCERFSVTFGIATLQ